MPFITFILGLLLGAGIHFYYTIGLQIEALQAQAKVEALLPLCPLVFKDIFKPEPQKAGK